jgi:hypothetical protein
MELASGAYFEERALPMRAPQIGLTIKFAVSCSDQSHRRSTPIRAVLLRAKVIQSCQGTIGVNLEDCAESGSTTLRCSVEVPADRK